MRTGRPKQRLILAEEEQERLQSLVHRARSQPALARRARVVLACAQGQNRGAANAGLAGHGRQVARAPSASWVGRAQRRAATYRAPKVSHAEVERSVI